MLPSIPIYSVEAFEEAIFVNKSSIVRKRKRKRYLTRGLMWVIGIYFILFIVASLILLQSVIKLQEISESKLRSTTHKNSVDLLDVNQPAFPISNFKNLKWPYELENKFNCSYLREVKNYTFISSGWTKSVYGFQYNEKTYALKTINYSGKDMEICMENFSYDICYSKLRAKVYKELILLQELKHENIIEAVGWCISDTSVPENIVIITELCTPFNSVSFFLMPLKQQLALTVHLSRLMNFLSKSPLGPVAINDFKLSQFVLCQNVLKLTDLDDLSVNDPQCRRNHDCFHVYHKFKTKCVKSQCFGYNHKQNLYNSDKHLVSFILQFIRSTESSEIIYLLKRFIFGWSEEERLKQLEILNRM